ncbi:hypothetical protein [Hyphomonas sp.]|uniref:hypothetical protein n=1 Tax=Hyphomonas sp. TaxID=87 RepID=UPI000C5789B8|nr:hypothetical protein [Hyphomonas sp.]MAU68375.1 hypothetical protein [Hyphomonas sp.]MBM59842.1 hypothetical protein [Hyphomonas sp.]
MEFKRWRLSATSTVVNAGLGLALLFTTAACSKPEQAPKSPPETSAITADVELPAVWATRTLESPVSAIALSGGSRGILAVAYEPGGLQFFDMEAERIGEPTNFRVKALAGGQSTNIGGSTLTVFPGVDREGTVKAYVFGDGLIAPAQVDLSVDGETFVEGLCSGPAGTEGIMRLAFWTLGNDRVLQAGIVKETDGELSWERGESTFTDFPIQSCAYTDDTLVASPRATAAAPLIRGQVSALLSLEPDSGLKLSTDLGMTTTDVNIRDGLSVFAPEKPVAMAAMGTMMSGGYPGGVIALAGEVEPGKSQVVFVDPSEITLPDAQTGGN